mgnify:CR=1 FL=1
MSINENNTTEKWTEIELLPEWDEEFYDVYTAKKYGKQKNVPDSICQAHCNLLTLIQQHLIGDAVFLTAHEGFCQVPVVHLV